WHYCQGGGEYRCFLATGLVNAERTASTPLTERLMTLDEGNSYQRCSRLTDDRKFRDRINEASSCPVVVSHKGPHNQLVLSCRRRIPAQRSCAAPDVDRVVHLIVHIQLHPEKRAERRIAYPDAAACPVLKPYRSSCRHDLSCDGVVDRGPRSRSEI